MNSQDKIKILKTLNEDELRRELIVPMLDKMEFKGTTIYHGAREHGKDIICFDYDKLGLKYYLGIVAKTGDLNGSVSSNQGLREIIYQVEQCFDIPYENLFGMNRVTMDQVWIITTGEIVTGAADSIFSSLEKRNLSKLIRIISGENLVTLIDEYFSSYWEMANETKEYIASQRDRIMKFCEHLLYKLEADKEQINTIREQLLKKEVFPKIECRKNGYLTYISDYSIVYDEICDKYQHGFFSNQCGYIKEAFFNARKKLEFCGFRIEEIIDNFGKVLEKTDPWMFIREFELKLEDDYPFNRNSAGNEAESAITYLLDGLRDIDNKMKKIQDVGKYEWAILLIDSVDNVTDEIEKYISTTEYEEFSLHWKIVE